MAMSGACAVAATPTLTVSLPGTTSNVTEIFASEDENFALIWTTTNAASVHYRCGGSGEFTVAAANASMVRKPDPSWIGKKISCSFIAFTEGLTQNDVEIVYVNVKAKPLVTEVLSVPTTFSVGGAYKISWKATNAISSSLACTLDSAPVISGGGPGTATANGGEVSGVVPAAWKDKKLLCKAWAYNGVVSGPQVTNEISTIAAPLPEIIDPAITPNVVNVGQPFKFSWSTKNVASSEAHCDIHEKKFIAKNTNSINAIVPPEWKGKTLTCAVYAYNGYGGSKYELKSLNVSNIASNDNVKGNIDPFKDGSAGGWACKVGSSQPLKVHLYAGTPSDIGEEITGISTVIRDAESAVISECGTTGHQETKHRWTIDLSEKVETYKGKTLRAYAEASDGTLRELNGSGTLTVDPLTSAIRGYVDNGIVYEPYPTVKGWSCNRGDHNSTRVRVYFGGDIGVGAVGPESTTSEDSGGDLATECGISQAKYRFSINLKDYQKQHGGKSLYLYGLSADSRVAGKLNNSGSVVLPAAESKARLVPVQLPTDMVAGAAYSIKVEMENTGTTTWAPYDTATGTGFALGAVGENVIWSAERRVLLPQPVPPGGIYTFTVKIKAPATPGNYKFEWQMIEEKVGWFGDITSNIVPVGAVQSSATVTLVGSNTNQSVVSGSFANIPINASAQASAGQLSKLAILVQYPDELTYRSTPLKVIQGPAALLALNESISLYSGSYRIVARAYESETKWTDSTTIVVNVSGNILKGRVAGVRTNAASVPELTGWVCDASLVQYYQLFVDAPPELGGVQLPATATTTNVVASSNFAIKDQCGAAANAQQFTFDLSSFTQTHPGRPIYVKAFGAGSVSTILACDDRTCNVPGTLRIGIVTPENKKTYTANPVFISAKVTGHTSPFDVWFYIAGTWVEGKPGADGLHIVNYSGLVPRTEPYSVYARVRADNVTITSEEREFYLGSGTPGTPTVPGTDPAVLAATLDVIFGLLLDDSDSPPTQGGTNPGTGTGTGGASSSAPLAVGITAPYSSDPSKGTLAGTLPGELGVSPSGAATYNIPLVVPPGTAGLQPNLSLNYSSSAQNGILGLGWSLGGLSSIHRCGKTIAQDKVNDRIGFTTADRLCLDGQRLVLESGSNDDTAYWADDAVFRTEIESFSRIKAMGKGDARTFEVRIKDGRIATYGDTGRGARVLAYDGFENGERKVGALTARSQAQSWAIDRIEDRYKNHISYFYSQANTTGEHWLTTIRYGGNGLSPHALVRFTYDDCDSQCNGNKRRTDVWTRYIDGTRNDLRMRVNHIKTYVGADLSGEPKDEQLVRDYALGYDYSPTSGRSLLQDVTVSARHPESGIIQSMPPTTFAWGKPKIGVAPGFTRWGEWPKAPVLTTHGDYLGTGVSAYHADYFAFNDFGNDGYMDVLEKRKASVPSAGHKTTAAILAENANPIEPGTTYDNYRYFHNTKQGFVERSYRLSTGEKFAVMEVADFDGDGTPDLLVSSDGGPRICLSPLGRGDIPAEGTPIVFNCDSGMLAVGGNTAGAVPFAIDIFGSGRAGHYSKMFSDTEATFCYLNSCTTDKTAPRNVLGYEFLNDGMPGTPTHDYVSFVQMVDLGGTGKHYEVRATQPHYTDRAADIAGGPLNNSTWFNTQPVVIVTDFRAPNAGGTGAKLFNGYSPAQLGEPCNSVACSPYSFEMPSAGAGLSADFNGSGYGSLVFGYYENGIDPVTKAPIWKKMDMTVCLSTGRGLDCRVRKKYSGSHHRAVRAVGNFVGDGAPALLVEGLTPSTAGPQSAPTVNGKISVCRLTGDDTANEPDINDNNMICTEWDGATLPAPTATDKSFFADLLGTGRPQLIVYRSGKFTGTASNTWVENGKWDVYIPNDIAKTGQALDRIYQVTNGLGSTSSVEYEDGLVNDIIGRDGDNDLPVAGYPQHLTPQTGKIVKKLSIGNGYVGERTTTFTYYDAAIDMEGRGSLGFGTVKAVDGETKIATTTRYSQKWPTSGMVRSSTVTLGGYTLSKTTNDPKAKPFGTGTLRQFPYNESTKTVRADLKGNDFGTVETRHTYDDYGNLHMAHTTSTGGGTFETKVTTTFKNDDSNWLIGLPELITTWKKAPTKKTDGTDIEDEITRQVSYKYHATTGALEKEIVEEDTQDLKLVTDYVRELIKGGQFGLVTSKEQSWTDPVTSVAKKRYVKTVYDDNGRFPWSVTRQVNDNVSADLSETYDYFHGTGIRKSLTDPNGLATTWSADGFGRVFKEAHVDGSELHTATKRCPDSGCSEITQAVSVKVSERRHKGALIAAPVLEFADAAGRIVRTHSYAFDGNATYTEQRYDRLGRLEEVYFPAYYGKLADLATRTVYDDLSRVTSQSNWDEKGDEQKLTTSYAGFKTDIQNAKGQTRTELRNVLGQLTEVTDAGGGTTSFNYDAFGNLTRTVDPSSNIISVKYDKLGRKVMLSDNDLGVIEYMPDALGRVVKQSSAVQRADAAVKDTKFSFDYLDRMIRREEKDIDARWEYDTKSYGKGKLAKACVKACDADPSYVREYFYDQFGRMETTKQVLDRVAYTSKLQLDNWGRVITQTYQRGTDVATAKVYDTRYNANGYMERIERGGLVLWKISEQDAAGRNRKVLLGNGLMESLEFNAKTGRLTKNEVTTANSGVRVSDSYTYDVLGNVAQRTQYWDSTHFIETFKYDALNRLESSEVTGQAKQIYTYRKDGRINSKSGVGNYWYTYTKEDGDAVAADVPPHAPKRIDGVGGSYSYDLNGNMLASPDLLGGRRSAAWTSFDMPLSITRNGITSSFTYGAELQRTRQDRTNGPSITYAGAQEIEGTNNTVVTVRTYWPGGIGLEVDTFKNNVLESTKLLWSHKDRLGSPIALTGVDGANQERLAYDAWGKRRTEIGDSTPDTLDGKLDNKGFTGHEMLDQLDLVHMNGRVYDPFIGQFMSGDPLIQDPFNGQNYSRYSYVLNNPTNLVDPTGYAWSEYVPVYGSVVAFGQAIRVGHFGLAAFEGTMAVIDGATLGVGSIGTTPVKMAVRAGVKAELKREAAEQLAKEAAEQSARAAVKIEQAAAQHAAERAVAEQATEKAANGTVRVSERAKNPGKDSGSDRAKSTVQENKAKGDAFELEYFEEAKKARPGAVQQVTVKTDSGVKTRIDIVARDADGKIVCIECKASPTAPLTKNQKVAHPEIENTGATVVGDGKPGFPGGTKIPPTKIEIVRPKE